MTTTTTNTATALENIDALRLPQLQDLFAEVTGKTTRSPNKKYLIGSIRKVLDEQAAEIIEENEAIEKNEATATAAAAADTKPPAKAKRTRRIVSVPQPTTADTTTEATEDATADTTTEVTADTTQDAQRDDAADAATEKKLSQMTVQELQQRYLEVVGRPTGSSHRRYMIWKIRETQKGRIKAGPVNRRNPGEPEPDFMVLPLRMEATVVQQLDAARERIGDKSRMDLLRKAISQYLASNGETAAAAAILPTNA